MQPNAPTPNPPQPSSDYDFILNHGANQPKRSILPGAGSSKKQRILVVAAGAGILLVIFILVISLLTGGKKTPGLLDLAQTQQELIRVSAIATEKADSSATRNLAYNTQLTLITNQQDVLAQLKKQGQKPNIKQLSLKQDKSIDATLSQATIDNSFDQVFTQYIQKELTAYQQELKTVYNATSNAKLQELLNDDFSQASTLLDSTKSS